MDNCGVRQFFKWPHIVHFNHPQDIETAHYPLSIKSKAKIQIAAHRPFIRLVFHSIIRRIHKLSIFNCQLSI